MYDAHVRSLPSEVQLQLVAVIADEVATGRRNPVEGGTPLPHAPRLLDLAGVGAEIWAGIDPAEYVKPIRDEWDQGR